MEIVSLGTGTLWTIQEFCKNPNITHAKKPPWKTRINSKASQIFFGNTSVQQNIVKSISNSFFDFQWLAISLSLSTVVLNSRDWPEKKMSEILAYPKSTLE